MKTAFKNYYSGKKVLVTGHTGFKGSWLVCWLKYLGAEIIGYSLDPNTEPNFFTACHLADRMTDVRGDILDYEKLSQVMQDNQPEIVFHLAAQPIVRLSFQNPRETFEINIMGTTNILEAARQCRTVKTVIVVTSDKCYRDAGWEWGYREIDQLGGHEAYSTSKACAELVAATYQEERFCQTVQPPSEMAVATVRAGNVIGGGDWAPYRLVPDIVRAISTEQDIVIRYPDATRPWQHVLEALSGYLWLGAIIHENPKLYCSGWNFGPVNLRMIPVGDIVKRILNSWSNSKTKLKTKLVFEPDPQKSEAMVLHVDSGKAHHLLKWWATWDIDQTIEAIVNWYKSFYQGQQREICRVTLEQIQCYSDSAKDAGLTWVK